MVPNFDNSSRIWNQRQIRRKQTNATKDSSDDKRTEAKKTSSSEIHQKAERKSSINYLFIKVFESLGIIHRLTIRSGRRRGEHVRNDQCLTEVGLHVHTRAAVSMSTGTDFVVKRAVDSAK